ncbi:MAG: NAD(P)-dependent alcohol dehydrogenase [Pseudomonadota bacterium]|nr:NAD(P)-dependent alcohol dehydrogenase [Pseudomonadota bacterium]
MAKVHAYAAKGAKQKLEPFTYDSGPLGAEEVEVAVEYCGLCHSDLSTINNDWDMSQYPVIPGHEVIGRVKALGEHTKGLMIGQRVGIGWNAASCMHCHECMTGQHNLCAKALPTIIGHHGGFADKVRAHWAWTIPLPDALDSASAGPLLCGGVTVFEPLAVMDVKPTDRVGVVGIGGLGHLALRFASAWGCEVTAFTSNESKANEAMGFGAHTVVYSQQRTAMIATLRPNGRLHVVGAILEPLQISAIDLIFGRKRVSGSPNGAPATMASMLDFAARHKIAPQVEHFPMSRANDVLHHLESGKARYRIVLDPDFT